MTAPHFFVTGASGFVGRHVCRLLRARGHPVSAVVRNADHTLAALGVTLHVGDLWDEGLAALAASDAAVCIHCAGDPTFGNGPQYQRANVELTAHLLQVLRHKRVPLERFVLVSTVGVVDRARGDNAARPLDESTPPFPTSDYGRSKLRAEQLVRESGIPYAIVRPTMVVGDDMRYDSHFAVFARHAIARSLLSRFAWPGTFSVVHVDDLAEGLRVAALSEGARDGTFFCAGAPMALRDFFAECDPGAWRFPLAWAAALARLVPSVVPFAGKAMLFPALTASDARLRGLGWLPKYDARTALSSVVARERARLDPSQDPGGQTVVTGAASGLGRALAVRLAARRTQLLLVDRDRVGLEATAQALPNARIAVVDLADTKQRDQLVDGEAWNSQAVTELFACAGVGRRGLIQRLPQQAHLDMFAVNVLARLVLGHRAVTAMQRRQFGRVVMISSSSAFQPLPFMATYAATNSALLSLGEAWGYEVRRDGVHVMTVCPGGMQTNFQKAGGVREVEGEKLWSPDDVAEEILKGLAAGRTTLIVSFRSLAMSLLARALPRRMSVMLWGRLMESLR